ncbi:MAG: MFS transporter [Bacteroidales bacterium]|nr:MFS transporter [Bacteroidales bacterium]
MLSFRVFFQNRKYFAPAFLYSCFSLIFSTWVIYIPFVADKLNITEGKIGGALFFTALGSLSMLPVSNRLVDKLGVGRQAFFGFVGYAIAIYGMFLAPTYPLLCVALYIFGTMSSLFVIALNSLTATIEKKAGINIMSGSHGFWSIGGIIGASAGSFIAGIIRMPFLHITVLVVILISIQLWLRKEYFHIRTQHFEKEKHGKFPIKPLLAIASISLIIMVAEGAIADWSALYLKKVVMMKGQFLGLGYALFSVGMALGRFTGDALSSRLGSWKMLRISIGTALAGFTLVLLIIPFSTLLGFFIIGLGFSTVVPEVYRLASRIKGIRTADGVSFISATANVGFLTGPVVLGFIAELRTLHVSFMVLMAFVATAFVMALFRK